MKNNIIFSKYASNIYDQLKRKDRKNIDKFLNTNFIDYLSKKNPNDLFSYKATPHIKIFLTLYEDKIIITDIRHKNYIYNNDDDKLVEKSSIEFEKRMREYYDSELLKSNNNNGLWVIQKNVKNLKKIVNLIMILLSIIIILISIFFVYIIN